VNGRQHCCGVLVLLSLGCQEEPRCAAPQRPLDLFFEVLEPFPELVAFNQPLGLYQTAALPERMFVLEKGGRILSFDAQHPEAGVIVVADLSDRVRTNKECGLLGLAFHPAFAENGQVLLSYCASTSPTQLRYARYAYDFATSEIVLDSEDVFLELPTPRNFHQAGQIRFDPAGYLITTVGDTGPHRDPDGHAQNTGDLLGDVLRLDVDGGRPYAIPPDNPFAESGLLSGMGRPEIYAWGFRNPWSFSLDRATGELWVGDVGFETTEEVDWVRPGHNYGWPALEGLSCRQDECENRGFTPPVATFRNKGNNAVIGGYVYRGQAIPSLQGAYVFADFGGGALYGIFDPYGNAETRRIHPSMGLTPSFFHEDLAGELYFTDIGKGRIHMLVPSSRRVADGFPRTLSETGCVSFADGRPAPAGGALAYGVHMPLWSDSAEKTRYINLEGMRASVTHEGDLDFPIGTVLVKLFHRGGELVEGRLLVHHDEGGWAGYSYEWDPSSNDAVLLEDGKTKPFGDTSWIYPSRDECFSCHTSAAGFVLGPEYGQIEPVPPHARKSRVGSAEWHEPQLPWLVASGQADPFARREDEADDEHWVRSYLHANCSNCHRPGGASNADIDLRYRVQADGERLSRDAMNICGVLPTGDDLGISGAALLVPGAPERSLLLRRMAERGEAQMPPLASMEVDALAVERIERWIAALPGCP
jgi:glucose/arabinose dehydrogenase